MLYRHIRYAKTLKASSWRKIAIGTWRSAGDPSTYGHIELNAEPALRFIKHESEKSGQKITMTHFTGRVLAECIARHPAINSVLRFGRLYSRRSVDIFFQAATDMEGQDLSGITLRQVDQLSLPQMAQEMNERVARLRAKGDQEFGKMKNTFRWVPGWLAWTIVNFSGFFCYTLNLWSPLLGAPKDPFGSAMLTNIGSLGIDMAFVPLVPYSRVPLVMALGAIHDRPVVHDGEIVIEKTVTLGVTMDHRIIDGVHASHMLRTLKQIFANPELELKPAT